MIKVRVKYVADEISLIDVKGHALSGEEGKDLVCAGVSSVITGCLNSLDDSSKFVISLDKGLAHIEVNSALSEHNRVVLKTLLISLETIKESYPEYIEIREERK
ncbi:MAG: ribosomal-processing cysteine protease Prp [Coprobacillus sp.]|nr:ribosomal-processing cysteine protease Prp [Coprobacillus sp.]